MSTMRPASLPTVLEPEQAGTQRNSRKLFVPPLPTMPKPVLDSTSMCTGGSLASVVCWVCPPEANQGPGVTRFLRAPWLSPMAYWISTASPSQNTFVPTERLCPGGQLYSDCVSSCPPSCSAVAQGEEGSCGKECVSGCECPAGLFWDGAHCVPAAHCPCYHRRLRYAPGDTVNQQCNPWWVFGLWWATEFSLMLLFMLFLRFAPPNKQCIMGLPTQ